VAVHSHSAHPVMVCDWAPHRVCERHRCLVVQVVQAGCLEGIAAGGPRAGVYRIPSVLGLYRCTVVMTVSWVTHLSQVQAKARPSILLK
jgi:hypothetical protein